MKLRSWEEMQKPVTQCDLICEMQGSIHKHDLFIMLASSPVFFHFFVSCGL